MIKTILFDLDGTLIDTPPVIIETFKELFETYIKDVKLTDEMYESFLGQSLYVTFMQYVDQARVSELVDIYRDVSEKKLEHTLRAYPYAQSTLKAIKKKKIPIGIVTSKLKTVALSHLKKVGLDDFIDYIIGYEDVEHHKPDPEPLLKALTYFNAKPDEAIYIGDHENDIKAAKKAGMMSCAVTYSLRLDKMLLEQPDFVIDELRHIKDMI